MRGRLLVSEKAVSLFTSYLYQLTIRKRARSP